MKVRVRAKRLEGLMKEKGWDLKELSRRLGCEYSFVYRVMRGERNPGRKFIGGLLLICAEEGRDLEEFIFVEGKNLKAGGD